MKKIITILLLVLMSITIAACTKPPEEELDDNTTTDVVVKEGGREGINYLVVEAPTTIKDNGVIASEEWGKLFPDIYNSYKMGNDANSETVQYLDIDTYLKGAEGIYEGYGFAKDYKSARGHSYTLTDVNETARPHALANCLTCKTADFTTLVNQQGTNAYSLTFDEVYAVSNENVGCYTCHENELGNMGQNVLTHDYTKAIADQLKADGVSLDISVCGQCHTEYYFDGNNNKATSIPYTGKASMNPDAELAYYNSIGFSDWTQESTGANLLKVQHPEFETYLGSVHFSMGLSCADCHMATLSAADGTKYISHELQSPLNSKELLETCTKCHGSTDMSAKVKAIQDEVTARETEVGNKILELKTKLAEANKSGKYTEDELNAIRELYRSAQWYFDYDYVENAEGAHNSALAKDCLNKAEQYYNEAMALFK